jgi:hypothetical protein
MYYILKHISSTVLLQEYYKWLRLINDYGGAHQLTPSPLIDQVWHLHILDTESYYKVIHHYPKNSYPYQDNNKKE